MRASLAKGLQIPDRSGIAGSVLSSRFLEKIRVIDRLSAVVCRRVQEAVFSAGIVSGAEESQR
jgi:hypothetical protein